MIVSPDSRRIATAGSHKAAKVWEAETGRLLLTLRGHRRQVFSVAYSRDGRFIATGSFDGTARVWDAQTGAELRTFWMNPARVLTTTGRAYSVTSVAFDRSTSVLFTGSWDGKAQVWDLQSGAMRHEVLAADVATPVIVKAHPDGRQFLTTPYAGSVRLWRVDSGELVKEWTTRARGGNEPTISEDGRRTLVDCQMGTGLADDQGTIEIWDTAGAPREVMRLETPVWVAQPTFSPLSVGRRIMGTSGDYGLYQWEAFPWRSADYPIESDSPSKIGSRSHRAPMPELVRRYADGYWRERLAAEQEVESSNAPPAKVIRLPVDRAAFPRRDGRASPDQVDLTDYYTGELTEPFYPNSGTDIQDNDLSSLPAGLVTMRGIAFDVRGVVQLTRTEPLGVAWAEGWQPYPQRVDGIRVGHSGRRIHLLLGTTGTSGVPTTTWDQQARTDGTVLANLVLHYADGSTGWIDLAYGRDVRDWQYDLKQPESGATNPGRVAWIGTNPVVEQYGFGLRLYVTSRDNPRPDARIETLDLVSTLSWSAPFIIAITVD